MTYYKLPQGNAKNSDNYFIRRNRKAQNAAFRFNHQLGSEVIIYSEICVFLIAIGLWQPS